MGSTGCLNAATKKPVVSGWGYAQAKTDYLAAPLLSIDIR
jgi:hypothetical protein